MDAATTPVMACPVCRTGLAMAERQGIEIEHCPTCRGVWLDRGELDKIVERSTAGSPGQADPKQERSSPWSEDGNASHGYRKRRKSFLELFD